MGFRVVFTLGWFALAVYAVGLKYPHLWSTASRPAIRPPSPASAVIAASGPGEDAGEPAQDRSDIPARQPVHMGDPEPDQVETSSPGALIQRAWSFNLARRYAEAWKIASTLDDSSRAQLELRARTAAWAGCLEEAADLLPRWLAVAPRDAEAWALLADVRRQTGDVQGRTESLRRLAALRPDDSAVRRELAAHLAEAGDSAGAIDELTQLIRRSPDETQDVVALAQVYEQIGQLARAINAWHTAQDRGYREAEAHRRLARLYSWTGGHRRAVASYERYLGARPGADHEIHGELGLALLADGRPSDALPRLEAALSAGGDDPALWLGAATAATTLGQPERAAFHLRGLRKLRPLTTDEANWLAGQLEASGDVEGAIDVLEAGLEHGADPAPVWERLGDLQSAARHHDEALDAYGRIPAENAGAGVWLKVARAAAAGGQAQRASDAYEQALARRPGDGDLALEIARHHARYGDPVRALAMYERHLELAPTATGLSLELARAALAAGRPGAALRWTTAAVTAGETDPALLYAHAQALHLAGRPEDAAVILEGLLAASPDRPEWRSWLARTAQARGRHLRAYELFAAVLNDASQRSAELWLARGDAAAQGGDVARARQAYEEARAAGASDRDVLERLHALPSSQFAMPAEIMRDAHDVEIGRGGGQLFVWPAAFGRISGGWAAGHVRQTGGPTFAERATDVRVDHVFPTPRVRVQGGLGVQQSGRDRLLLWHAGARYQWPDAASVSLEAFRETPWSAPLRATALRFNRISDIAATGALFHNTGLRASADLPLRSHHALQAEIGLRHYSDGNASRDVYVQYQHRLSGARRTWVALQPHLYVEQWDATNPAYFSPDHHVTLGATLRAIAGRPAWSADIGLTPQALFSNGRTGFGARLSGGVTRRFGRASAGGSLMWFFDRRYSFDLWHATAQVAIPIGK